MFGNVVNGVDLASTETASLRCSTRAYKCNGTNLSSDYPTTQDFSTPNFSDCVPRPDNEYCPSALDGVTNLPGNVYDTSSAASMKCNPLTNYKVLPTISRASRAARIRKIMVAGIFGYQAGRRHPRSHQVRQDGFPPTTA